jgi:hypothetical protein
LFFVHQPGTEGRFDRLSHARAGFAGAHDGDLPDVFQRDGIRPDMKDRTFHTELLRHQSRRVDRLDAGMPNLQSVIAEMVG